jgi:hypothetical protein
MSGWFSFIQIRNGSDILNVFTNGVYEFPTPVLSGAEYNVTADEDDTSQCTVQNGSGTITNAPVTVDVVCGGP